MWVCFVLPRCNILVWWDWNIFIWLKGKCCILRQARTPCRFQLNPLESRDTVEFCAIQLAMLGLLRRVSCPVPSVQCLASVKCQGCRHRAYKLQTETNKTLQYWLSTTRTACLQTISTNIYQVPSTLYWLLSSKQFAALFMGLTAAYNRMIKMMSMKSARYPFQTCIQYNTGLWTQPLAFPFPHCPKTYYFLTFPDFHILIHDRK